MRYVVSNRAGQGLASLARISAITALGLGLSACAWSRASYDHQSQVGAPPAKVAIAVPPKVVIEADGVPSQPPPLRRRMREPDDPTEPFSPNYGPAPEGAEPEPAPVRETVSPTRSAAGWAPVHRTGMSEAEANALIAKAITAHEARNP